MARNEHEFEISLNRTASYYHGAFERELEVASRSIGLPPTELTRRVAALLLGQEGRPGLRSMDSVPSMPGIPPEGSEVRLPALALAGSTRDGGMSSTPGGSDLTASDDSGRKSNHRIAMTAAVKHKISVAAKRRWAEQKRNGIRSTHLTAGSVRCQTCGATPPASYVGQSMQNQWLKRHMTREHPEKRRVLGVPGKIPGVRPGWEAKYQQVLELRKQGLNREQIAAKSGISTATIDRWCGAANLPSTSRASYRKYDETTRERALRMVRRDHIPQARVAQKLGINVSAVQRWVNAVPDERSNKVGRAHQGTAHSEAVRQQALDMVKQHPELSHKEIERRLKLGAGSIHRWLRGGMVGSPWHNMTPTQRHDEMVRRRKVAAANKAAGQRYERPHSGPDSEATEVKANGALPVDYSGPFEAPIEAE